jgi:hypothetical protein
MFFIDEYIEGSAVFRYLRKGFIPVEYFGDFLKDCADEKTCVMVSILNTATLLLAFLYPFHSLP